MPAEERRPALGASLAHFRGTTRRALGLAVIAGLALLVVGCGGTGENGTPTKRDRSKEAGIRSEGQGPATRGQPEEGPRQAGSRRASDPSGPGPQGIPGMDADAVAAIFLKPGLECYEPVDRDVLYACSSEEDDRSLEYEGRITGRGDDLVSTVEARVLREEGSGDFGLASQPYFGLLSTQLEYRGSNKKRAYEFVSQNLDSTKANTTIGTAQWTMTTSRDRKTLVVAPGE